MSATMEVAAKPSLYWNKLAERCERFLKQYGYKNFKRSVGLVYNDFYLDYDSGTIRPEYNQKLLELWDALYERIPTMFLDRFSEPEVGSPFAINYNGRLVSFDLASSCCETAMLFSHLDMLKIKSIHEIGGGYGRLAYVLGQSVPKAIYRLYDIEPSIGLAMRYLTDVLPNRRGFYFHTPDELKGPCDLLVAMDCLHEMTKDQVEAYFEYADKNAGYFYFTCWKETAVPEHGISWKMDEYPVRPGWVPVFRGDHKMRTGFFEALYRINKPVEGA